MTITAIFKQFAAYNQWANTRVFAAALALPEEDYRRPTGVFFKSLHGTLNHLLVADRIWLWRLTGEGEVHHGLNAIIHDDREALAQARAREDERLISVVAGFDEDALISVCSYHNSRGQAYEQRIADILLHVFNHQTHHRGQAHACCSILTGAEPPSLDLLAFQRRLAVSGDSRHSERF